MHQLTHTSFVLRISIEEPIPAPIAGCPASKKRSTGSARISWYRVGHRGACGLVSESILLPFEKGIVVGVNITEFDIHVTQDHRVLIYHDASFNSTHITLPDGQRIPVAARKKYIFNQMDYTDILPFAIGQKYDPAFPRQQQEATDRPLLYETVDKKNYPPVIYLLEVKSGPGIGSIEQPPPAPYMETMMGVLKR